MAELPITRIPVSEEKQLQIRRVVSQTRDIPGLGHVAGEQDIKPLAALWEAPEISEWIYTLPKPINEQTVADFIDRHQQERERGEGLLIVSTDAGRQARAYYDIQFWPQWGACELGGALRQDLQSSGRGGAEAFAVFRWLFEVIGVDLICETSALDNIRTMRLLERIGFVHKCQVECHLADGGIRPSRYWELSRESWQHSSRLGR